MRQIFEISNEASPGTKENWYEVYDGGSPGANLVATFYTRDELEIYLHGLDHCQFLINKDEIDLLRRRHRTFPLGRTKYRFLFCVSDGVKQSDKYTIIPYEPNE